MDVGPHFTVCIGSPFCYITIYFHRQLQQIPLHQLVIRPTQIKVS